VNVQNLLTRSLSASPRYEKNIYYNSSNKGSKFNNEQHYVSMCHTKSVGDAVFVAVVVVIVVLLLVSFLLLLFCFFCCYRCYYYCC